MINFLNLHKINERFRNEIDERIKQVLDSGWYILGEQVRVFEKTLLTFAESSTVLVVLTDLMHSISLSKRMGFQQEMKLLFLQTLTLLLF